MVRALLLDLDDTLYDRGAAFRAWADRMARAQLGRPLADAELATLCELDERGHRDRRVFAHDAAQLGLAIDHAAFAAQVAEHATAELGVREAIEQLAARHRVAIVTNGGPAQRTKLARIGLADVVHAVFVSGELGVAKPANAIFETALRWTECAAGEVMFVGDHPWIDLAPARAIGMITAWRVRGDYTESRPLGRTASRDFGHGTESRPLGRTASRDFGHWPGELAPPDHHIACVTELIAICEAT